MRRVKVRVDPSADRNLAYGSYIQLFKAAWDEPHDVHRHAVLYQTVIPKAPLTGTDVETIYSLIYELAEYEKAASSVKATPETLAKTLAFHDPSTDSFTPGYARTFLLVAPEGEIAGMALYFYNYSTWTGPGVYLEDLFVKPKYRKRGYGKTLIKACAKECIRIGGERLEWSCLDWNTPSLEFYESLGATQKKEWVGLRAEGEALAKLAE